MARAHAEPNIEGDRMKKVDALKQFFATPEKPVTASELMDFRKFDTKGFDELAELAAKAMGQSIDPR